MCALRGIGAIALKFHMMIADAILSNNGREILDIYRYDLVDFNLTNINMYEYASENSTSTCFTCTLVRKQTPVTMLDISF